MVDIFNRDQFISECVDGALKDSGHGGHPLGEPIKEIILNKAVVPQQEWEAALRQQDVEVDQVAQFFKQCIKEAIEFFPLDYLTVDDLPVVLQAVELRYRPMTAFMWPIKDIAKCLREKFA
ncbi:hypothetical protein [Kitasatospora sp. NPDC050463]|uniref:hypothetical protein n=1 Tax=Kitasatospora sp. NPDC050463 TaxID=3155786 RepID=UPI0033E19BBF